MHGSEQTTNGEKAMKNKFALASTAWSNGKTALYLTSFSVSGTANYSSDASKARTFPTHAAANGFRRKNERGWGWEVVEVSVTAS